MIQGAIQRLAEKKNIDEAWFYGMHFRPTSGRDVLRSYKRIKRQRAFMQTVLVLFLFLVVFIFAYAYVEEGLAFQRANHVDTTVIDLR